jgi:hypothetical protein
MEELEFFKLDETDRKVLVWLTDHVKVKSIKSWIEFIADDYQRRKGVLINTERLFLEAQECI